MNDINQDFAHIICNVVTRVIEQHSKKSIKIKFEHGYIFDGTGCIYLKFFDWPDINGKNQIVEVRYPSSFFRYDRATGNLTFSPFENLFFLMNSRGYPNAHVWGQNGRLCRGKVLIEQPFSLVEAILSVLLQKNTSKDSLEKGRPTPESTLRNGADTVEEWLAETNKYKTIIQKHFYLQPELFEQKGYFIKNGDQKIKLGKNLEIIISRFLNTLNVNYRR